MSSTQVRPAPSPELPTVAPADRFMRRLLGISSTDKKAARGAHRAFRTSIIVSAVRCLISYVAIPILIPITAISGAVVAPLSIALSLFAMVNGVISVRRFWISNHRHRWMYTWFMVVVFAVLIVALVFDINRLVTGT
ncbi:hypothetical protein [Microbacterium sp. No. 7]|uniref:hypothetical protein n=1 Tax=Microbacterium sp. No. 7 TaxID=1714373 RepID=UPI0006D293FD|nr:hypothetical protein [Microbacterium sp. No. 7]ALJ18670.1 hypothetical protein AOA12_01570 [Microbacterium sp. No. 7]